MHKEIIGNATLYHGDCMEILQELNPADHIICDPPYENKLHDKSTELSKRGALKDKRNPFTEFNFESIEKIRDPFCQIAKEKCKGWFINFCIAEGVGKWEESISNANMKYKRACIWIKPDGMPQFNGQCPALGYECFIVAWAGAGHSKWNGGGKHGIYTFNKGERYGGHPTEKPLRLMKAIINDFTNEGQTIIDPFMGSGSTGVACVQMDMKFIGIELDQTYFDIACKRIEDAQKQYRMEI